METEVCRLKKAYGRKKEEFERASAEGKALNPNSTYVKPKLNCFSDSLLDTEATIEIENQFGAEETSGAHISKEQTLQEERPEQRLEEESRILCFGSEASVSRKEVDHQSGQEVAEVLLAENTDTEQTSQSSQSDELFIELEALNLTPGATRKFIDLNKGQSISSGSVSKSCFNETIKRITPESYTTIEISRKRN